MGDKSPKANQKKSGQKDSKINSANQKKIAAIASHRPPQRKSKSLLPSVSLDKNLRETFSSILRECDYVLLIFLTDSRCANGLLKLRHERSQIFMRREH